jgi:hypothetical protein
MSSMVFYVNYVELFKETKRDKKKSKKSWNSSVPYEIRLYLPWSSISVDMEILLGYGLPDVKLTHEVGSISGNGHGNTYSYPPDPSPM